MAETTRQQVYRMFKKDILTLAQKRAYAVAALKASGKEIKTVADAKAVLAEINQKDCDAVAASWYRECSRQDNQLKALLREYRAL